MQRAPKDIVLKPFDESLLPQQRLDSCLSLSSQVEKMATFIIAHTIVDYEEQLAADERLSVASAFLQRVTSTHLCNHKLTKEGIEYRFRGEVFHLHEEFKTMTLTRTVYEHLAMFYFLYNHPKSAEERTVVWNYWKINSRKNLLDLSAEDAEVESLRREIFATRLGHWCHKKLDEWTSPAKPTQNGSIEFYRSDGKTDVRRIAYSQAWKYLYDTDDMAQLYRHLSMHCHPILGGLLQYQTQTVTDEGNDGIPLYLSACFLAYLCRLYLRLMPDVARKFNEEFSEQERLVLKQLAQLPNE
jgi:hypothetical protein